MLFHSAAKKNISQIVTSTPAQIFTSSAMMLVLCTTVRAAAGDIEAVMARLEKLEADNRKIASENATLKERLYRLERVRHPNARDSLTPEQMKAESQSKFNPQPPQQHGNAIATLPVVETAAFTADATSNWKGFYGGLNAGYSWGASNTASTSTVPLSDAFGLIVPPGGATYTVTHPAVYGASAVANTGSDNVDMNGIVGGLQAGYNHLLAREIIIGLEADIQGASIDGSGVFNGKSSQLSSGIYSQPPQNLPVPTYFTFSQSYLGSSSVTGGVRWIGTTRARLGWLAMSDLLIYGTGGLAYGNTYADTTNTFLVSGTQTATTNDLAFVAPIYANSFGGSGHYSSNRVGYAAGGGIEWLFMPNWSLKSEAFYYDLGRATFNSSIVGTTGGIGPISNIPVTQIRFDGIIARAGINYHFNASQP